MSTRLMDIPILFKIGLASRILYYTIELHALSMIGTIYHVENWLGWVSFNQVVYFIFMIGTLY